MAERRRRVDCEVHEEGHVAEAHAPVDQQLGALEWAAQHDASIPVLWCVRPLMAGCAMSYTAGVGRSGMWEDLVHAISEPTLSVLWCWVRDLSTRPGGGGGGGGSQMRCQTRVLCAGAGSSSAGLMGCLEDFVFCVFVMVTLNEAGK